MNHDIDYASPHRLPWREKKWNKWVLRAWIAWIVTFAMVSLFFGSETRTFLVRPRFAFFFDDVAVLLALTSILASALAVHSSAKRVATERGQILGATALIMSFGLCFFTVVINGPAAESVDFNFQQATQQSQSKILHVCLDYREEHGRYPRHLAELVAAGDIGPEALVNPFTGTTPAVLPLGLKPADWRIIVPLIDAHSELIYVGGDLDATQSETAALLLLYDKSLAERPCRLTASIDGGVQLESESDFLTSFSALNAWRSKSGFAPLTLDVSPPPPK